MIYLLPNWLVEPKNEDKVYDLLDNFNQDLITDDSMTKSELISELEKIGETIIIEKIKNKEISFGA